MALKVGGSDELNQMSVELFRVFSRCEYALKAANLNCGEGAAEANWKAFAQTLSDLFEKPQNPAFDSAVEYLLSKPPKAQRVRNGLLVWEDVVPTSVSKADLTLLYVRRVRNNLFHGGKFGGHWLDPFRSTELIAASLTVLKACVQANSSVREAFSD